MKKLFQLSVGAQIALSFAAAILLGSLLLLLPFATNAGHPITPLEALFTATSAACVTGLTVVDTGATFSVFGKIILAALIQFGGLGIAVFGTLVTIALGKGMRLHERSLVKESWNLEGFGGLETLLPHVLIITFSTELLGALLALPVFLQDYAPMTAIGFSLFHGISAFNNAGFDLLGNFQSLTGYRTNLLMTLSTSAVVIIGGFGYLALLDIYYHRRWKKLTLQTRVVTLMTVGLLLLGTLLLMISDHYSPLDAFFQSMSARTAGFNTVDLGAMSNGGLFTMTLLMIVGASPGSTGGGIKTTTVFALLVAVRSATRNETPQAMKRRVTRATIYKATVVTLASVGLLCVATFAMTVFEPQHSFIALLFETTSAVNTVGLTTGITPQFGLPARLVLIMCMYLGRIGPLTAATLWANQTQKPYRYSEEHLTIG